MKEKGNALSESIVKDITLKSGGKPKGKKYDNGGEVEEHEINEHKPPDLTLPSPSMYSSPRIIISHPCSGSSATIKFAEKIMNAHGYKVLHGGQPFLYKKATVNHKGTWKMRNAKQDLIDSGSIGDDREPTMTEITNQLVKIDSERAQREGKILLYKANNINADIVETLKDLNSTLTITYRKNTLDKAICVIRDCFQTAPDASFGHQVYSNGTKADLCFSRRNSKEPIQAMITDGDKLVKYLSSHTKEHQLSLERYSYFLNGIDDTAAYEHLFAFEYTDSEETFERSIEIWMTFLKPLRLNLDRDVVSSTLKPFQNSRIATVHSEVVYNMDVLHSALDGTQYQEMISE